MRRMVADLLETHDVAQYQPTPFDAVDRFQPFGQFPYRLLVQGRLLLRERTEGLDFGLVRKVGDDPLIGLEPAENIRADQAAESTSGRVNRGAVLR